MEWTASRWTSVIFGWSNEQEINKSCVVSRDDDSMYNVCICHKLTLDKQPLCKQQPFQGLLKRGLVSLYLRCRWLVQWWGTSSTGDSCWLQWEKRLLSISHVHRMLVVCGSLCIPENCKSGNGEYACRVHLQNYNLRCAVVPFLFRSEIQNNSMSTWGYSYPYSLICTVPSTQLKQTVSLEL